MDFTFGIVVGCLGTSLILCIIGYIMSNVESFKDNTKKEFEDIKKRLDKLEKE